MKLLAKGVSPCKLYNRALLRMEFRTRGVRSSPGVWPLPSWVKDRDQKVKRRHLSHECAVKASPPEPVAVFEHFFTHRYILSQHELIFFSHVYKKLSWLEPENLHCIKFLSIQNIFFNFQQIK